MGNKKPKFKIGERVRVKTLAEAKEISYAVEINKPLKKYLGKNFVVTGFREVGGMFYYYLKERSSVCVHECLLDYPYGDFSHPQNPKYSVGDNVAIKETELQRLESENYLLHKAREISGEVTDIEKNKCITYEKTLEEKLKEVKMDYIFGKITLEEAIKIINGENSLCQPQSNE